MVALRIDGEVDHHDGVLLQQVDEHDHAHIRADDQILADDQQRGQCPDGREGQSGDQPAPKCFQLRTAEVGSGDNFTSARRVTVALCCDGVTVQLVPVQKS